MPWTREYLCTGSDTREKEKERNVVGEERGRDGQNSVSGSSDNFSPVVFETQPSRPPPSRTTERVGTFFIKISFEKRRRVSCFDLSPLHSLNIYARIYIYTHMKYFDDFFLFPSIDRSSIEKLSRSFSVVGKRNGMVERATAPAFLSSKRELRFREQQVLTVPLCGARYGWRDIEGRTEEQSCNERRSTPQNSRLRII